MADLTDDDLARAGHVPLPPAVLEANTFIETALMALRALPYPHYLLTQHWLDVRDMALRAQSACERCGATTHRQVHHKTYEYLGRERLSDLEVLCGDCHYAEHRTSAAEGRA